MRVKTEAMRLTLLDAATNVFLEQGFERALMSDISNRAGCSKGTLYSYFKSKEDLFFEAVMGCPENEAEAVIADLVGGGKPLEEALLSFGIGFLTLLYSPKVQALRRLIYCDTSNSGIGHRAYEQGILRCQAVVGEYLSKAMAAGKLRQTDPLIAADHLFGLLESELLVKFLLKVLGDVSHEQLVATAQRAVEAFLNAYGR